MTPSAMQSYVADCLGLGPGWVNEPFWYKIVDILVSVRESDGLASFYEKVGRHHASKFTAPDCNELNVRATVKGDCGMSHTIAEWQRCPSCGAAIRRTTGCRP